jgi:hypothetical protein
MGAVKRVLKKAVSMVVGTPSVAVPEPAPVPTPAPVAPTPAVEPVSTPKPTPAAAAPVAVTDPVAETTATQDMEQSVQRKKRGRKNLIATGSQGLGGEPTTYKATLLG